MRFWNSKFHFRTYQPFSEHRGARIGIPTIIRAIIGRFKDQEVRLSYDTQPYNGNNG